MAQKKQAARKFSLRRNPTVTIEIDGRDYDVQLGNVTFAIRAARWQESLQRIVDGDVAPDDLASAFEDLADEGRALVASLMGDEAAGDLLGGDNSLNLYRVIDLVIILADVVSGEESKSAMRALARTPDTADED